LFFSEHAQELPEEVLVIGVWVVPAKIKRNGAEAGAI